MNWQDVLARIDFCYNRLPAAPITIVGDDADNTIAGTDAADGIDGWIGNDTISGAGSDDLLIFDVVQLYPSGDHVDLAAGLSRSVTAGTDALVSIEGAIGRYYFGDTLIGNAQDNLLIGGAVGQDYLHAGDGADILWGMGAFDHVMGVGAATISSRKVGAGSRATSMAGPMIPATG